MRAHSKINACLDAVEAQLRALGYWQGPAGRPAEEAFLSQLPFCLDTMELPQWLEYVLLVKLREMLAAGSELPSRLAVAPMAQEYWRGHWGEHRNLIAALRELDLCFGTQEQ